MDLGFFRRTKVRIGDRSPAALDYGVLLATLQAFQSASATARAENQCREMLGGGLCHDQAPLLELLLGRQGWRGSVLAQAGSFHRGIAASRVNLA
jgi:hypothetical protein